MTLISKHIRSKLHSFLFFSLVFISTSTFAQVKFSTVVNERQVGQNEYVQVEYTIENAKSIENFSFPAFKQFRIVQGPVQSSGMSVTNGVMSQYKGMSFILQPAVAGKLKIPGATAVVDGKLQRSNSVMIDVLAALPGNHPSVPSSGSSADAIPEVNEEYSLASDENLADKIRNNLMVIADVNKHSCYEGEPIVATYKLYSRLRSESRVIKRPSLNGFSVFDMIEQENNNPTVEQLNGKSYNVHIIRKTQLFPLQAGTFVLDPVELDNKVRFIKTSRKKSGNSIQHFFDEFLSDDGSDDIQEHTFTLGSKPLTIVVKPLPANKPANFNGAIGAFTIDAALKNQEIHAGDAIQLRLAIKGQGNFTMINAPVLSLPAGMEAYEPSIKEDVDKSIYPLSGVKTFDYILNGKDTGWYNIPPVEFSYFDPASGTYRTSSSSGFKVHIIPAVVKSSVAANAAANVTAFAEQRKDGIPVKAILLALAVVAVASLGVYQWKIHKKQSRSVKATRPGAAAVKETVPVISKDLLDEARWALQTGESQRFYKEVNKAAWKVVTEKVNLPATGLNKPNTIRQLQYKGVNADVIEKFESVLNECEMALYTPVHDISDMHQTLNKAEDVIKTLKVSLR
jgi:hypothetical protein